MTFIRGDFVTDVDFINVEPRRREHKSFLALLQQGS